MNSVPLSVEIDAFGLSKKSLLNIFKRAFKTVLDSLFLSGSISNFELYKSVTTNK